MALAVVVPAGALIYYKFILDDAPPPLKLPTSVAPSSGTLAGTWHPTSDSQFGYRVNEVLFGQSKAAAGRTNQVTGSLVIDGDKVMSTELTVDMASVHSDAAQRDGQFRGRIMNVSKFPTATFKLSDPIALPGTGDNGQAVTVQARGDLTLRGTTKEVTIDLSAVRDGANFTVKGTVPIVFADWNIPNPTFGPATTEDHGQIEFLVVFSKSQ